MSGKVKRICCWHRSPAAPISSLVLRWAARILPVGYELQMLWLGMAVDVYGGQPSAAKREGELVCTRPFPGDAGGFSGTILTACGITPPIRAFSRGLVPR